MKTSIVEKETKKINGFSMLALFFGWLVLNLYLIITIIRTENPIFILPFFISVVCNVILGIGFFVVQPNE
ncbi:MAG: SPFH domain-containing protein, partial [Bacteroidota bacterium]|nr:SPFH domain-containing protein [Bacteroidota bacterium]